MNEVPLEIFFYLLFNYSVHELKGRLFSIHHFTLSPEGLQFLKYTLPEEVPSTSPAGPIEIHFLLDHPSQIAILGPFADQVPNNYPQAIQKPHNGNSVTHDSTLLKYVETYDAEKLSPF